MLPLVVAAAVLNGRRRRKVQKYKYHVGKPFLSRVDHFCSLLYPRDAALGIDRYSRQNVSTKSDAMADEEKNDLAVVLSCCS